MLVGVSSAVATAGSERSGGNPASSHVVVGLAHAASSSHLRMMLSFMALTLTPAARAWPYKAAAIGVGSLTSTLCFCPALVERRRGRPRAALGTSDSFGFTSLTLYPCGSEAGNTKNSSA